MSIALLDSDRYPRLTVEIDLNGPNVANPGAAEKWADITEYVRELAVKPAYRQNAWDRFEAGTLSMVLDNNLRRFDPTYAAVVNLLSNPSAESDVSGWAANAGTLSRDNTDTPLPLFGEWQFKGTASDASGNYYYSNGAISGETAGRVYSGSMYVKGTGATIGKQLELFLSEAGGASGEDTGGVHTNGLVTLTGGWQRVTCSRTITQNDRTLVRIYVSQPSGAAAGDVIFWDAAQIEEAAAATPYIDGPIVVKPNTKVRVRATWDGVTYDAIKVFMDGAPQEYPSFGTDALVKVTGTDAFKVLNLADLDQSGSVALKGVYQTGASPRFIDVAAGDTAFWINSWPPDWPDPTSLPNPFYILIDSEWINVTGTGGDLNTSTGGANHSPATRDDQPVYLTVQRAQVGTTAAAHTAGAGVQRAGLEAVTTGSRVTRVLQATKLDDLASGSIDAGISTVVAVSPGSELKGVDALPHLQDVMDTENGQLFVNGSGLIVFEDRHERPVNRVTPVCTFGDRAYNMLGALDPSFEAGVTGWNAYGAGCTRTRVSSVGQAFADGDWIGQFTTVGSHQGISAAATVAVEEQTLYTYSAYINANSGFTTKLWIDWLDESLSVVGSSIQSFAGNGVMTRCSFSPTSPQGAAWAQCYVLTDDATPQTVDVEAIQLEPGAQATEFTPYAELAYEDVVIPYDDDRLWNVAKMTCSDASNTVKTWQNDVSVKENGPRALERTLLTSDTVDAENAAQYYVFKFGDAELRFDQIAVQPVNDPARYWPAVLGLKISDRVTILRRPKLGPVIARDNYLEAMPQHEITPHGWKVTLSLSDAEKDEYWLLGDAALGVLGSTTKPGY